MIQSLNVAAHASGGGSTVESLLHKISKRALKGVRIPLLIASKPGIGAIAKAKDAGLSEKHIYWPEPEVRRSESLLAEWLLELYEAYEIDVIGQYGWLVRTPRLVVLRYRRRSINQHPGPLDPGRRYAFGGKGMHGRRVHGAVLKFMELANRAKPFTEATAQEVEDEYDAGQLLATRHLPIVPGDTIDSVAGRLLRIEHELQAEVLQQFADDRVRPHTRPEPLIADDEIEEFHAAMLHARIHVTP